ncbi:hypothetical protein PG988_004586 [Apiospora saccharicola]
MAGGSKSGIKKGTLFLSTEHDRFAVSRTQRFPVGPLNPWRIDMCQRAFLRDQILDYADVHENHARVVWGMQQSLSTPWSPDTELLARHIADHLPRRVLQKVRRVVSLHSGPEAGDRGIHVCGEHLMCSHEWNLRSFKGAHQLYTAHMFAVPTDNSQAFQNLLEWERVEENGVITFKCMCDNHDEHNSEGNDDDNMEEED